MILHAPDGKSRLSVSVEGICRVCQVGFIKTQPMQVVCGLACAKKVPIIARNTMKAERKKDKARLAELKPRSHWLKEAQREFNSYIRARDADKSCISCRRFHQGQWHAGHYLSVGARPELRFDEDNVHRQCQPCNTHLHGNLVEYRGGLLDRIGPAVLARLEGPHPPKHYTTDELKAMAVDYRQRAKALKEKR